MAAIEILGLEKTYALGFWRKKLKRALKPLHLRVENGEIFGFLGPNGAGKTTTLKMLMGLVFPTAGTARILDMAVSYTHLDVYKRQGLFCDARGPRAGSGGRLRGSDLNQRLLDRLCGFERKYGCHCEERLLLRSVWGCRPVLRSGRLARGIQPERRA